MDKQQILHLMQQALRDGDTYVIVQRGNYTQIGLRSADGKQTVNITAAVCQAFGLPHHGLCAIASESQVRDLLPRLQPMVAAKPAPKSKKTAPESETAIPDFDNMANDEVMAWIANHPDAISANKSRLAN